MDGINHEELSRCLFEESNDAFFIFDPDDNRIVDANPTAERLTGTRRKQLLGMKLPELLRADDGHTLEELIHAYQSTGFFHSKEGYCLRSNKSTSLAVNLSVSRIHTTPKPLGLIVARDISKRKQAEQALKRANEELEDQVKQRSAELQDANKRLEKDLAERNWLTRIYREAPVGLCCFDTQLRYLDINEWLAALNGLSVEEHLGRSVSELFPDLAAAIESQLRHVIETGQPMMQGSVFAETLAQPSVKRHFQHNYDAVKSDDGTVVGVSCAVVEITERKRAEEALQKAHDELERRVQERTAQLTEANEHLREEIEARRMAEEALRQSEAEFRLLANNVPALFSYVGADGCYRFVNRRYEEWFGIPAAEIMGKHYTLILGDSVDQRIKDHIEAALSGKRVEYEIEAPYRHGGTRWVNAIFMPDNVDGEVRGFFVLVTDISERKRAEEQLRFTQFAIDNTGDAAFWIRSDARFFFVNEAACRSLGYSREELLSKTVHDIDPCYPEETWSQIWADIKERKSFTFESCHRRKDGTLFPVEITVNFLDFDGQEYNCAFARDITERKQVGDELRVSEGKIRAILEAAVDGFITIDERGIIESANPAVEHMFGYTADELIGRNVNLLIPEPHRREHDQYISNYLHTSQPRIIGIDREIVGQRRDGTVFLVDVSISEIKLDNRRSFLSIIRDIT
ncbi:MAG: PAS domain S-box protein, partial [Planctomycetes bacterium]|nr:PAS domain S-box protein [Planctomycetota bacterium]